MSLKLLEHNSKAWRKWISLREMNLRPNSRAGLLQADINESIYEKKSKISLYVFTLKFSPLHSLHRARGDRKPPLAEEKPRSQAETAARVWAPHASPGSDPTLHVTQPPFTRHGHGLPRWLSHGSLHRVSWLPCASWSRPTVPIVGDQPLPLGVSKTRGLEYGETTLPRGTHVYGRNEPGLAEKPCTTAHPSCLPQLDLRSFGVGVQRYCSPNADLTEIEPVICISVSWRGRSGCPCQRPRPGVGREEG